MDYQAALVQIRNSRWLLAATIGGRLDPAGSVCFGLGFDRSNLTHP